MRSFEGLTHYGTVHPDKREFGAFFARFKAEDSDATTTIVILLSDSTYPRDLVITNMVTYPASGRNKGLASDSLEKLLVWAKGQYFPNIRAVQVQPQSESFWSNRGFWKQGTPTNDFLYCP